MNTHLKKIYDWLKSCSPREQGLIFFAVLAVLYSLWNFLFWLPLSAERKATDAEMESVQTQITATQTQTQVVLMNAQAIHQQTQEYQALQQKLTRIEQQLGNISHEFVAAQEIEKLLSDLLRQQNNLTLMNFKNLPAEMIAQLAGTPEQKIYKHGMIMELRGNYFGILNYLKHIEKLNWHLFWDSLDYQVTHYPEAMITIKLYTLNNKENWLDV